VLVVELSISAGMALEECRRRGLTVRSERQLAGKPGSHHWHPGIPGRPGTVELNEWRERVWVNVHPLRDGGWSSAFAQQLAQLGEQS
jgi:hypothetical protein